MDGDKSVTRAVVRLAFWWLLTPIAFAVYLVCDVSARVFAILGDMIAEGMVFLEDRLL